MNSAVRLGTGSSNTFDSCPDGGVLLFGMIFFGNLSTALEANNI